MSCRYGLQMWGYPGPDRTKVSLGFTGSLDATNARTGLDCYLMTCDGLGGQIVFSDNYLVLISAEDLPIWLGTGNYRDRPDQAAGSEVPAFCCFTYYQPRDRTL